MIYRNLKTGVEIKTNSVIIAPDYVLVHGLRELAKENGVPIEELHAPEPESKEPVVEKVQKASKSKSTPKKKGSKK